MRNILKSIVLLNLLSADGNNAKLYKQTKQILTFEFLVLKEIKIKPNIFNTFERNVKECCFFNIINM